MARKPTGGKPGRPKADPARDALVFQITEWVMLQYDLPIGSAQDDDGDHSFTASVVVAWLLSGLTAYSEHIPPKARHRIGWDWILGGVARFQKVAALLEVPADARLVLAPHTVRDIHRKWRALPVQRCLPPIRDEYKPFRDPHS